MQMEPIVSLCKRRGFLFQSSEIYGGLNGFWDYGPVGVELKRNIKEAWWRDMVTAHDDSSAPNGAPSSYEMTGLGYLGVDVVIDREQGPLILELNARPGLAIQIANQSGLGLRLEQIDHMAGRHSSVDGRVDYVRETFGQVRTAR